jgi:Ring finger domain
MEYWCHVCRRETEFLNEINCINCNKDFIEKIDRVEDHPRNFVPFNMSSRSRMLTELILMPTLRSVRYNGSENEPDQSLDAIINQLMLNDQNRYGPPPASRESISCLKEILITQEIFESRGTYNKGIDEYGQKIDKERIILDCSVCKEEFECNEKAIDMPCLHLYHRHCIQAWLESHNNCPTCRYEFPTDDPDYEARRYRK